MQAAPYPGYIPHDREMTNAENDIRILRNAITFREYRLEQAYQHRNHISEMMTAAERAIREAASAVQYAYAEYEEAVGTE